MQSKVLCSHQNVSVGIVRITRRVPKIVTEWWGLGIDELLVVACGMSGCVWGHHQAADSRHGYPTRRERVTHAHTQVLLHLLNRDPKIGSTSSPLGLRCGMAMLVPLIQQFQDNVDHLRKLFMHRRPPSTRILNCRAVTWIQYSEVAVCRWCAGHLSRVRPD